MLGRSDIDRYLVIFCVQDVHACMYGNACMLLFYHKIYLFEDRTGHFDAGRFSTVGFNNCIDTVPFVFNKTFTFHTLALAV